LLKELQSYIVGMGGDGGSDLINVKCEVIGNWHNSPVQLIYANKKNHER
jgi:hypothetical protein